MVGLGDDGRDSTGFFSLHHLMNFFLVREPNAVSEVEAHLGLLETRSVLSPCFCNVPFLPMPFRVLIDRYRPSSQC